MVKVVFTGMRDLPQLPADEEKYRKAGAQFIKKVPCSTEEEVIAGAGDADAVITVRSPYTRRVIENLSRCRLISVCSAGYEYVDVDAATEYGICRTGSYRPIPHSQGAGLWPENHCLRPLYIPCGSGEDEG